MAAGYLLDAIGLPMAPALLAAVAILSMAVAVFAWRERPPSGGTGGVVLVVAAAWAYAMWLASPSFLPVTNGPDVVHHLLLIHLIARTGRLAHDPALSPYLLEMMNYTPGSQILAAAAGAWLRVDPLRLVYPIAAFFVAVKAGMLFEITRRLLVGSAGAGVRAAAAPVVAFVPVYFLGSFVQFFFFAQVISETCAIGMVLASLLWLEGGRRRDLVLASACGVGVVLAWPVWIAPVAVTLVAAVVSRPSSWRDRITRVAAVMAPAGACLVFHQLRHPDAAGILTAAGAVTPPSVAAFGAGFLAVALVGTCLAFGDRRALLVVVMLAATLLQAFALAALSVRAGSGSFYLAFKMMYLAILPAAVLGALALARAAGFIATRLPRARLAAAWLPLAVAVLMVRGHVPVRRVHGSLSLPARDVALWARDRVPPACIDYFSAYWLTGYWLHLDVLGNPRLSDRMRQETFDFPDAAAKWIEGRGLPFAIVEDMTAIPREVRADMVPLQQSGTFVLVRNLRPAACAP